MTSEGLHLEPRRTLRLILYVFIVTFVVSRIVVFLIMDRLLPDMYLHVKGTHVHHLNYGIFLLSGVGAFILVKQPTGFIHDICTVVYAIGLGLTFDEFGMWLHLGGPYWQRASFDAVVVISSFLAFLAFLPPIGQWSLTRWKSIVVLVLVLAVFGALFAKSLKHAKEVVKQKLQAIEELSPP